MNAIPSLFVFMTLASPIVRDHHGLFITLSFLLMLKRIDAPSTWMWFVAAYFLEFVLPSLDFFPWSYGRLIALMIALWLMVRTAKNDEPSSFIACADRWLANLAG